MECNDFIPTTKYKIFHNFLKHYDKGKTKPFKDKPVEVKHFKNITTYEITVGNHGKFYNFNNSQEVVNNFLNNIRSKFKASNSVMIKCDFSIENVPQKTYSD